VIDCARQLPFDEALAVADSALRSGEVTPDELHSAACLSPRTGRRAAVRVAEAADGRASGPFESVLRGIAKSVPGLQVTPQHNIDDLGYADLADPVLRIVIEADSYEFHAGRGAFRADVHRYNAFVRHGWIVLRFLWADVMHLPDYVHDVLVDVVALRERYCRHQRPDTPHDCPTARSAR
jgi:very-short-patch-repair endonuclease